MKILIIGAGYIAAEYCKSLKSLGYSDISVLARSEDKVRAFAQENCCVNYYFDAEATLAHIADEYDAFIVATPIETLLNYVSLLGSYKDKLILVEKPVCLSSEKLKSFLSSNKPSAKISVALNRLYYPSLTKLKDILTSETITSCLFSFTEWAHAIDVNKFPENELARWGISNSIHVINTVFDLIGLPKQLNADVFGQDTIAWHPSGATYIGCGISAQDIPFAYHSDWRSVGRWQIEVKTTKGGYLLAPMEDIKFTKKGTLNAEEIYHYDESNKCGFDQMLSFWINDQEDALVCLDSLVPQLEVIERIFHYD